MIGPDSLAKEVADHVYIRMRRQAVLASQAEQPCKLRVTLAESALRLPVGSPTVMREQYQHLLNLDSSTVDLRVIPLSAGAHVAPFSPFTLLRFDIPDDHGVLYTEGPTGGQYFEASQEIAETTATFNRLTETALSPEASREFISQLHTELTES